MLIVERVPIQNKPIQNQNTARRGAISKRLMTLNLSQQNNNKIARNELPSSTNVPAMLTLSFTSWVRTLFPHVSVLVSFARQTIAGTKKKSVKLTLITHKKEKIQQTTQRSTILKHNSVARDWKFPRRLFLPQPRTSCQLYCCKANWNV